MWRDSEVASRHAVVAPEISSLAGVFDVRREERGADEHAHFALAATNADDGRVLEVTGIETVGHAQQCADADRACWVRQIPNQRMLPARFDVLRVGK